MNDSNRRLDDLCERHRARLVSDLVRFGSRPQEAEEIAQDALLAMWKRIDRVQPGAEWTYVRTAAHRLAINAALRRKVEANSVPLDVRDGAMRDATMSAEARVIRDEEAERFRRTLHAALSELPDETRLWIVMRRRGISPHDIAKQLGVGRTAVRSRRMRAFKQLRERVGAPPPGGERAEQTGDDDDDEE